MVDRVDRATRSRMMASVQAKDTRPELAIRRALHARGFRYRVHVPNLPGKPDIVFRMFGAVIFVNGCFWHGHDCVLFQWPATRREFWREKIRRNRERDSRVRDELRASGWRCLTVWECATRGPERRQLNAVIEDIAGWLTSGGGDTDLDGRKDRMAKAVRRQVDDSANMNY